MSNETEKHEAKNPRPEDRAEMVGEGSVPAVGQLPFVRTPAFFIIAVVVSLVVLLWNFVDVPERKTKPQLAQDMSLAPAKAQPVQRGLPQLSVPPDGQGDAPEVIPKSYTPRGSYPYRSPGPPPHYGSEPYYGYQPGPPPSGAWRNPEPDPSGKPGESRSVETRQ